MVTQKHQTFKIFQNFCDLITFSKYGEKKQNLIISYHILQVFTTLVLRPWKLSGFKMTTFHHISISKQYIKHFKILKSYSTSYKTELTHDGETKTNLIQIPPPKKDMKLHIKYHKWYWNLSFFCWGNKNYLNCIEACSL